MFVFVIPLVVASIVCGIFYAQMKTANEQTHANAYMPAEGLALSVVEDTYTHTTETSRRYDPVKGQQQFQRVEYRQRRFWRQLGRKILNHTVPQAGCLPDRARCVSIFLFLLASREF